MAVYRDETGFEFRVADVGEVRFDRNGNLTATRLAPQACPELLDNVLIGHILPLVWSLRGGFTMHSAVVATRRGAVLFFGPSGAGKSTLAASFEGCDGCTVLDDDAGLLKRCGQDILAYPTGRGVSLWSDSLAAVGAGFPEQRRLSAYGTKFRARRANSPPDAVWPEGEEERGVPLVAAYHLLRPAEDDPAQPVFEPMTAADKHLRLGRSCQRLDLTDTDQLQRQFAFLSHLITRIPICRLRYRRSYATLPDVRRAVLEHIERPIPR
jgi:hypothetical protein